MVAKSSLYGKLLGWVDIALKYDIAVGRYPNVVGQTLYHLHRLTAQHTRQEHLIHIVGHRSSCRVGVHWVSAQGNTHWHTLTTLLVTQVVARTSLMAMPVHTRSALVEDLHSIHSHIRDARLGIFCADHRQGDKRTAVGWPRCEYREFAEVDILALPYHLLALASARYLARKPLRHILQQR